jgi:hypothetical protein
MLMFVHYPHKLISLPTTRTRTRTRTRTGADHRVAIVDRRHQKSEEVSVGGLRIFNLSRTNGPSIVGRAVVPALLAVESQPTFCDRYRVASSLLVTFLFHTTHDTTTSQNPQVHKK